MSSYIDFMFQVLVIIIYFSVLFGDSETGKKILAAGSPRTQKSLGRKVQNFDDAVWKANCRRIVADGNYLKVCFNLFSIFKIKNIVVCYKARNTV